MGLFSGLKRAYAKHGGAWFAVAAVVGVVAEGVVAYRAGKRCGQHPEWTEKEKAMNIVAPVGIAVGTTVAIGAGQHKNAGEIATLMSTQLLNEKNRQKWVKNATDIIGEDNMKKIKESMRPVHDVPKVDDDGRMLVIDDYTGAKSYLTYEEIYKGIDKFHAKYHTDGFASHGYLLECLKMERFDGKNNPLPLTEDDEGNLFEVTTDDGTVIRLSDEDIGYSVWKQNEEGFGSDWIDIWPVEHEDKTTGNVYVTIELGMYPVAGYKNY